MTTFDVNKLAYEIDCAMLNQMGVKTKTYEEYQKWDEETQEERKKEADERKIRNRLATEKFGKLFEEMQEWYELNNCDFDEFMEEMGYLPKWKYG